MLNSLHLERKMNAGTHVKKVSLRLRPWFIPNSGCGQVPRYQISRTNGRLSPYLSQKLAFGQASPDWECCHRTMQLFDIDAIDPSSASSNNMRGAVYSFLV